MSDLPQPENPVAPWQQRQDWASGRIEDEGRSGGLALLVFALVWNGISWTITIAIWSEGGERGPAHYFILLFPFIGLFALVGAIYALVRRGRYGVPVFELATLPAPLGRALGGHVRIPRGLPAASQIEIGLKAIHRTVTRTGKNTSTREVTLWENQRVLPGAVGDGPGVSVPIAIPIPREAPETSVASPNDRILWRLEIRSAVPGVDFLARFEVPVFYTSESETPLTPEEVARFG
jgi:hypothetical protein